MHNRQFYIKIGLKLSRTQAKMLFKVATCEMHAKMQSSTAKAKANSFCTIILAAVSIEWFSSKLSESKNFQITFFKVSQNNTRPTRS